MKKNKTDFNFIGLRFIAYAVSLILVVGSMALVMGKGLNFGIDFTGGTVIEVRVPDTAPDLGALRTGLNNLGLGDISIQEFGAADDLLIRLPQQDGGAAQQQAAIETVKTMLDDRFEGAEQKVEYRRIEFVGPQVGEELKRSGMYAVLFSIIGMMIYIWFRFEWQYGVAAILALIHDAVATLGLFALTGMSFDLSTVAAVLMIVGYSINDTVVIFDRVRENFRKFKKMPATEVLNRSINETLSRTIITGVTTLLALGALWLFGGEVIRGFVDALIFGIVIGTYSSVFVAAPLLLLMPMRRKKEDGDQAADEKLPEQA